LISAELLQDEHEAKTKSTVIIVINHFFKHDGIETPDLIVWKQLGNGQG
jgi:hypothetical protein